MSACWKENTVERPTFAEIEQSISNFIMDHGVETTDLTPLSDSSKIEVSNDNEISDRPEANVKAVLEDKLEETCKAAIASERESGYSGI